MYKASLNRVYQNTLSEAKHTKLQLANLQDNQITSKAFLQGKLTALSDVLTVLKLAAEEIAAAETQTEESKTKGP